MCVKILCGHATELFGKLDVSTRCSKNSGSMKIYITENDVTLFLVCVWGGGWICLLNLSAKMMELFSKEKLIAASVIEIIIRYVV